MIKGKKVQYHILVVMVVFVFIHRFLIQQLGLPESIKYLLDLFNLVLFAFGAKSFFRLGNMHLMYFLSYSIIILCGTAGFLVYGKQWNTPLINYAFDFRNLIRFPLFVISCSICLNRERIEKLFDLFVGFNAINSIYIIYQYFTLEVTIFWMRGDNLNGFFGTERGGNQFVNILLFITTVIVLERWKKKQYKTIVAVTLLGLNLLIAVLIELKIFFLEMGFAVFFHLLPYIKRLSLKKIIVLGSIIIMAPVLYVFLTELLYKLYPTMEGTLSLSGLVETNISDKGYTGQGDLNRLNALSGSYHKIFHDNFVSSILGYGFGTANSNGEFAQKYEYTHYTWLSTAYMYVETGILGFVAYAMSLLVPCFTGNKKSIYYRMSFISALFTVILMIYDEALRTEAAYMIFLFVSIGLTVDLVPEKNVIHKLMTLGCKKQ